MTWVFAAGLILLAAAAAADFLGGQVMRSGPLYLLGAAGAGCLAATGGFALTGRLVTLDVAGWLGDPIPGQRAAALAADRLSGLFLAMAFGAALPISVAFASWAWRQGPRPGRLGASYALALGAVAVIVTARDAFTALFGWEALTVAFQIWLPRGYAAAPGPARAIMAGVCVNVAFYGMWRTLALLGRAPGWLVGAVLVLGAVTALLGIAHAAVQNRLSRVIAYSVIAAGLSPVVPGGLVMGALKSPWVLQPVFAGFSILSPSWLWLEMPVMLLLVVLFSWAVSGRRLLRVRRVPPWRSATIGVDGLDSYTAFGYANPTRRVLAGVLHTRAEVREVMLEDSDRDEGVGPPDRGDVAEQEQAAHLKYASDVMEVVEAYLYRPALRGFLAVVAVAKRLQSGRLDAYLLCMLIALIAVIAVVTALA